MDDLRLVEYQYAEHSAMPLFLKTKRNGLCVIKKWSAK